MNYIETTIAGYDKIARDWHGTRRHSWDEVSEVIAKHIHIYRSEHDENIQILDLGCGNGRLIDTLRNLDLNENNYLGLDPSRELINIAQNQYREYSFEINNGLEINLPNRTEFDIVISLAALHHVPPEYQDEWLHEVYNSLRVGGLFIITVWQLTDSFGTRNHTVHKKLNDKNYMLGFAQHTDIRYVYNFDFEELQNKLIKAGFVILESDTTERPNSENRNIIFVCKK